MKTFSCECCHIEVIQNHPMIIPHCSSCGSNRFMNEIKTIRKNEFLDGYLAAVQFVATSSKDTRVAEELIIQSGFSKNDLIKSQLSSGFANEKMMSIIDSVFK